MTYVVITVAGVSSRFNQGMDNPVLKCLYHTGNSKKTLLYSILQKCSTCSGVIIVGGYQFQELEKYVDEQRENFSFGIEVVYNPYYQQYGSGYSLKVGLQECLKKKDCTEILFVEGDLVFDSQTMEYIFKEKKNCLTVNSDTITSHKSVAVYINQKEEIKFLYDTSHGFFQIDEPFSIIYNSGQVWKFAEREIVEQVAERMEDREWFGTNLKFIEAYFNAVPKKRLEIVKFKKWVNCNMRADYLQCEKDL